MSHYHYTLKKRFYLWAIISLVFASNCSKIPENNDPILGIWSNEARNEENGYIRQEWIFNDVYLGRFHQYHNYQLVVITDFGWSLEEGAYTISYRTTDMPNDVVHMETTEDAKMLVDLEGKVLARRE